MNSSFSPLRLDQRRDADRRKLFRAAFAEQGNRHLASSAWAAVSAQSIDAIQAMCEG